MREQLIEPIMKLWPLIMVVGGGLWTGAAIKTDVENNKLLITKVQDTQEEHIDEAVRAITELSTKLDILIQQEHKAQRAKNQENE